MVADLLLSSHLVISASLRSHGLQHTRLPCPSLSSRACSNSCLLSWWWSNHLLLCYPLLLLPSIFPSIRAFSNESVLDVRWPMYWSFSFSISSSNEYSGLISFRIDWFELLAVQETLKSHLQHHSSKASVGSWLEISNTNIFFLVWLEKDRIKLFERYTWDDEKR